MSKSKPRIRLLVSVFAVVSMIGGSFIVVANAAPGKGKGKGGRPGPRPSASARPEKPAKAIQTRLRFRLDTRHIEEGGSVIGTARLGERVGKGFVAFAGQTLHVFVDKSEQDAVTTDAEGKAIVTATGGVGGHVVKVVYAGDATHRPAKRAQGFHVGSPADCEDADETDDDGDDDDVQAFGPGRGGPGRGGPGDGHRPPKRPKRPCRDHDHRKGDKEDFAKEDDEEDDDDKEDADDDASTGDSLDSTTDDVESTGDSLDSTTDGVE